MLTVEITIKLPKDEHDALVKDAYENFRTVEGQIRWALKKSKERNDCIKWDFNTLPCGNVTPTNPIVCGPSRSRTVEYSNAHIVTCCR